MGFVASANNFYLYLGLKWQLACQFMLKKAKKIPFRKKCDFNFVTGTGQISTSFMDDLKILAHYM